jgi:hypothetical protein
MRKLLLLVALLAAALVAQQPAQTGTVKGTVTVAGKPASGFTVMALSQLVSSFTAAVATDAQGEFTISGVPLGAVEFRVFDTNRTLAATGKAELTAAGQTLTLPVQIP